MASVSYYLENAYSREFFLIWIYSHICTKWQTKFCRYLNIWKDVNWWYSHGHKSSILLGWKLIELKWSFSILNWIATAMAMSLSTKMNTLSYVLSLCPRMFSSFCQGDYGSYICFFPSEKVSVDLKRHRVAFTLNHCIISFSMCECKCKSRCVM